MTARILVVDDEESLREVATVMLSRAGYLVTATHSGESAVALLGTTEPEFDLVLTDLRMRGVGGLEVLRAAKEREGSTQVVLMTAYASAATAVQAMRDGAYDYIEKPFKKDALLALLEKALEKRSLLEENVRLKRRLWERRDTGLESMIGASGAMRRVYTLIRQSAPTNATVLVTGESGTGKELVARAIHDLSDRADGPFIPLNCGAIPESLIESELFGHVKGAFTGAQADRRGMFAAANGGTIFLDEVGELPSPTQVKLLRVLEEREVRPVGSATAQKVDVRVVAATNRDLLEEVQQKNFRADLFYRLNVIEIGLPALRDRGGDIPLLVTHFVERFSLEMGRRFEGVDRAAMDYFQRYDFPGNVRELENMVRRAVTLEAGPTISTATLQSRTMHQESLIQLAGDVALPDDGLELDSLIERLERSLLTKALDRTNGNRTEAARLLGISFRSIRYRLDKHGL